MSHNSTNRRRLYTGAAGVIGSLLLAAYFGLPALYPRMSALIYGAGSPSNGNITAVGNHYRELITLGSWAQGTGALLCALFFLGLVDQSGEGQGFAGRTTLLGCSLLVGLVLIEMILGTTWAIAAHAHDQAVAGVAFKLTTHFQSAYPVAPAPTVYLSVAAALRRGRPLLPAAFGVLAAGIGIAFLCGGILQAAAPSVTLPVAVISVLQVVWILGAGALLMRDGMGHHDSPGRDITAEYARAGIAKQRTETGPCMTPGTVDLQGRLDPGKPRT